MSATRINIDGTWYVREDHLENDKDSIEIDPTEFEGCVVENQDFCFEATRLDNYPEMIDIKFTDKRGEFPWQEETWDNIQWFNGLLDGNQDSLKELHALGPLGKAYFIKFLQYLRDEKQWL